MGGHNQALIHKNCIKTWQCIAELGSYVVPDVPKMTPNVFSFPEAAFRVISALINALARPLHYTVKFH